MQVKSNYSKLLGSVVALSLTMIIGSAQAQSKSMPDDPNTVVTVMQFSARDDASVPILKERMREIRDYLRAQPGYIQNELLKNLNTGAEPDFVGVSRWKTIKDWEAIWLSTRFQELVNAVNAVGILKPGAFVPQK